MADRDLRFDPHGCCPMCGYPWDDGSGSDGYSSCDHEAGWYRTWLYQATEMLREVAAPGVWSQRAEAYRLMWVERDEARRRLWRGALPPFAEAFLDALLTDGRVSRFTFEVLCAALEDKAET